MCQYIIAFNFDILLNMIIISYLTIFQTYYYIQKLNIMLH